jgi:hypothetical protein
MPVSHEAHTAGIMTSQRLAEAKAEERRLLVQLVAGIAPSFNINTCAWDPARPVRVARQLLAEIDNPTLKQRS